MNERHEEMASALPAELDALPRLETFIDAAFEFALDFLAMISYSHADRTR